MFSVTFVECIYLTSPPPDALSHLGRLRRHRLRRRLKSEMVVDPICSLSLSRQRLFISFPTRSLAPPAATVYRYDEDNPLSLSLPLPFAFLAFARKRQNRVLNAGGTHARARTEELRKRGSIIFRFFPVCSGVSRTSYIFGNFLGNAK